MQDDDDHGCWVWSQNGCNTNLLHHPASFHHLDVALGALTTLCVGKRVGEGRYIL